MGQCTILVRGIQRFCRFAYLVRSCIRVVIHILSSFYNCLHFVPKAFFAYCLAVKTIIFFIVSGCWNFFQRCFKFALIYFAGRFFPFNEKIPYIRIVPITCILNINMSQKVIRIFG